MNTNIDLENVDGFVIDLSTPEQVKETYKFLFGNSKLIECEEVDILRREIIGHYSATYKKILHKGKYVYQIIETGEEDEKEILHK